MLFCCPSPNIMVITPGILMTTGAIYCIALGISRDKFVDAIIPGCTDTAIQSPLPFACNSLANRMLDSLLYPYATHSSYFLPFVKCISSRSTGPRRWPVDDSATIRVGFL